jgi:chromate reductase
MKKILAFTGSNHSKSINRQVLKYALTLLDSTQFEIKEIDLREYEPVMLSLDYQKEHGIPKETIELNALIQAHDGFIIASPEHNGSVPAFLKNTTDWLSRHERKFFQDKPILLLSTSDGANGGKTNLEALAASYPRFGAKLTGRFSLPKFSENFQNGEIVSEEEKHGLLNEIEKFAKAF